MKNLGENRYNKVTFPKTVQKYMGSYLIPNEKNKAVNLEQDFSFL